MDLMPQGADKKGALSARLARPAVVTALLAAALCAACVGCDNATPGPNSGPNQPGANGPGPPAAQHCLVPIVTAISPTVGSDAGGDAVTITGRCFTDVSAVDFGQSAAPKQTASRSGTRITATTPPGAGTVDVRVVTPAGTSAAAHDDRFTYRGSA